MAHFPAAVVRASSEEGSFAIWTALVMSAFIPMIFLVAAVSENLTHQTWADGAADAAAAAAVEALAASDPSVWGTPGAGAAADEATRAAAEAVATRAAARGWIRSDVSLRSAGTGDERLGVDLEVSYSSAVVFWASERSVFSSSTARFTSAVAS